MTSWTRCWLAALFVGCLLSVVCWTESFVDFDFFSAIFISLIIKDIRNAPHRRLEIKEVSEQDGFEHPDQLATHIMETSTAGGDRVTRPTCNSGVSFRNQYNCWSQWPTRCSQLWSHIFLVWTWISWKFIDHRRRISNGWVLSLKVRFLLNIRFSQTLTSPSIHFHPAFRVLKRRKMSE